MLTNNANCTGSWCPTLSGSAARTSTWTTRCTTPPCTSSPSVSCLVRQGYIFYIWTPSPRFSGGVGGMIWPRKNVKDWKGAKREFSFSNFIQFISLKKGGCLLRSPYKLFGWVYCDIENIYPYNQVKPQIHGRLSLIGHNWGWMIGAGFAKEGLYKGCGFFGSYPLILNFSKLN